MVQISGCITEFGIEKNIEGLKALGAQGSYEAAKLYVEEAAESDLDDLKKLFEEDCVLSCLDCSRKLAKDAFAVKQHTEQLRHMYEQGWSEVLEQYIQALDSEENNTETVLILNGILLQKIERECAITFEESPGF